MPGVTKNKIRPASAADSIKNAGKPAQASDLGSGGARRAADTANANVSRAEQARLRAQKAIGA